MEKQIYVTFHVTRGGKFNNGGFKKFHSEQNFNELVSYFMDALFIQNRDKNGKFCKPFIHDGNGVSLTNDDWKNGLTGTLDFDGEYDTLITKNIVDCDELELQKIKDSQEFDFCSEELQQYINKNCVTK
jgi:hypothetical protein